MIDNPAKTKELMQKMKGQLPIPARPTNSYIRAMRDRGSKVKRNQRLQIYSILYTGDEGGILCSITPPGAAKEVQLVSLTHLEVNRHHPLAQEIRTYQRERTQKIAQSGRPGRPSKTTIRPRKRRK